jgi:hypothetical protein
LAAAVKVRGLIRWQWCIWLGSRLWKLTMLLLLFLSFFFFKRAGIDTRTNLPIFTIGWRCGVSTIGFYWQDLACGLCWLIPR